MESHRRPRKGEPEADFIASYRPLGEPQEPAKGSLEHFLLERYASFAPGSANSIYRGPIRHAPWRCQDAEAEIKVNTVPAAAGLEPPDQPVFHYSPGTDSRICWVERLRAS